MYTIDGVLHYCVANMPGAVPRTSTFALTNATLPWTLQLARLGAVEAIRRSPQLASAANVVAGKICHAAVAETFELEFTDPKVLAETLG